MSGVAITKPTHNSYLIPNTGYVNPALYDVEADASAATYPLAIAAITGGKITCEAVGSGSVQGDAAFCHLLAKMGCTVEQTATQTTVQGPPAGSLKGLGDFDMESMTDAFMTAAVLAAVATGTTRILGVANQRVKECNRIQVMQVELTKCGVTCRELDDGIEIEGAGGVSKLRGAIIKCHDDHRRGEVKRACQYLCRTRGIHQLGIHSPQHRRLEAAPRGALGCRHGAPPCRFLGSRRTGGPRPLRLSLGTPFRLAR